MGLDAFTRGAVLLSLSFSLSLSMLPVSTSVHRVVSKDQVNGFNWASHSPICLSKTLGPIIRVSHGADGGVLRNVTNQQLWRGPPALAVYYSRHSPRCQLLTKGEKTRAIYTPSIKTPCQYTTATHAHTRRMVPYALWLRAGPLIAPQRRAEDSRCTEAVTKSEKSYPVGGQTLKKTGLTGHSGTLQPKVFVSGLRYKNAENQFKNDWASLLIS